MKMNQVRPIMLIGSMKCGTSKLYDYLAQHPEICPCNIKEPQYFSEYYSDYQKANRSYESFFDFNPPKHKYVLDGSTGYAKYPTVTGVPNRIKEYGLDPFFIMIVRNPFDRIRSHYNFMQNDLSWKYKITSPHLINTSKYYMQLQQYVAEFAEKNILVVDFDELKKDPISLSNKVFDFVGAGKFKINLKLSAYQNKTQPVNRKKMKIDLFFDRMGLYRIELLKKVLKKILIISFPSRQKLLSEKESKFIKKELQQDMSQLYEHYGIDIKKWGFTVSN